jgi:hypothetical protein
MDRSESPLDLPLSSSHQFTSKPRDPTHPITSSRSIAKSLAQSKGIKDNARSSANTRRLVS